MGRIERCAAPDDGRVIAVIAARMDSERLPGKPLRVVRGRPLLDFVHDRARRIAGVSRIVLATTERAVDDPLVDFAASRSIEVFRGDGDDVAARFLACAEAFGADVLVRLNGDSPFLDPDLVGQAVARLLADPDLDLVTNLLDRTYPYGVSAEAVRVPALARAYERMDADEREHVTAAIYRCRDEFHILNLTAPTPDDSGVRLVVDTPDDLDRFELAAARLGTDITTADPQAVAAAYRRLDSPA